MINKTFSLTQKEHYLSFRRGIALACIYTEKLFAVVVAILERDDVDVIKRIVNKI